MALPIETGKAPVIVQYWHSEEIPAEIAGLLAGFRQQNPDLRHLVFNEADAAEFIGKHFGPRELDAFAACARPTAQADYFRCCATLVLGGIYADADIRCLRPLASLLEEVNGGELFGSPAVPVGLARLGLSDKEVFGTVDRVGDYVFIANGFFAFRELKHPLLKLTVEITTAHIESRASEDLVAMTGGVFTSLYLLRELGSFDAYLEYTRHGSMKPVAPITCEAIGDYQRVLDAFTGVRIAPVGKAGRWVRHTMPSYKQTDAYWTRSPDLLR